MKKIFTILALAMISVMSWATVSITVTPNVIDFGTVYLDENGEADSDWKQAILTWSGLIPYCSVFVDTIDAPDVNAGVEFRITSDDGTEDYDSDYWYGGDEWNPATNPNVWVKFYAIEPGDYSVIYRFFSYENEDDWYYETNKAGNADLLVKVKVLPHQDTGVENAKAAVKAQKVICDGQVLIIRNGEKYDVTGAKVK